MSAKKPLAFLLHALIGWFLCAATMSIGQALTTVANALVIHAIAAPIIFFFVSYIYFTRFNYTKPLLTAVLIITFVIAMDFFVVAMTILKSMEMFASLLGTWIPFALILTSTYLTGIFIIGQPKTKTA